MKYKLIVFDLDGTLVNTLPDIAHVFNTVLSAHGYPVHPQQSYRNFVGWGLREALELALPESASGVEDMMIQVIAHYTEQPVRHSNVYPGMENLLKDLESGAVPKIIFTNKNQNIAKQVVSKLLPRFRFETVLGDTGSSPHKPSPEPLLQFLSGKSIPPSSILMVGDTPVDLETARNAGIAFAGAGWGFRTEKELADAGSEHNFAHPDELRAWLSG